MPPQPPRRRHHLQGGDVAGGGQDHVGLGAVVVARPAPDRRPAGAVLPRRVHVEPLGLRLLVDDDEVHVVPAPEAMIRDGQQAVGVRWQIDT